jgi:hypothetical protein
MTEKPAFVPMPDEQRRSLLRTIFNLLGEIDDGLPVEKFETESGAIEDAREKLIAGFGKDYITTCEGCSCHLFVGDRGHRCLDGELLCEACTPSWDDVKEQWAEGRDDDGDEDRASFMARYEKHIADGGHGTDLMLYNL